MILYHYYTGVGTLRIISEGHGEPLICGPLVIQASYLGASQAPIYQLSKYLKVKII